MNAMKGDEGKRGRKREDPRKGSKRGRLLEDVKDEERDWKREDVRKRDKRGWEMKMEREDVRKGR
jgi:hypothetical protein